MRVTEIEETSLFYDSVLFSELTNQHVSTVDQSETILNLCTDWSNRTQHDFPRWITGSNYQEHGRSQMHSEQVTAVNDN